MQVRRLRHKAWHKAWRARLAGLVAGLILLPVAWADDYRYTTMTLRYDLDSTTTIYCRVTGPQTGRGRIKTSGSSQNVTESTSGNNPFAALRVGDVIAVDTTPTAATAAKDFAYIITRTDSANVVVNPAVNWDNSSAGYPFQYYAQDCGSAVTDGWVDASGLVDAKVTVRIKQMNATAVLWRIEGKDNTADTGPNVIYPGESSDCGPSGTLVSGYCSFTNATDFGGTHAVHIPEVEGAVRVGMKIDTDDGGDLTTNAEQITITLSGRVRR